MAPGDLELEEVSIFNPEDDPDGVPVSVRSISDWEIVTMLESTFSWVPLVACAAGVGVWVPGGTYLRSRSLSEETIIRGDSATDLDLPLE